MFYKMTALYWCRDCQKPWSVVYPVLFDEEWFDVNSDDVYEILPQEIEHKCGGIADLNLLEWGETKTIAEIHDEYGDPAPIHDVVKERIGTPILKVINRGLQALVREMAKRNG